MQDPAFRIEAMLGKPCAERLAALHPREKAREAIELILGEPERTADVAHGALAAIADDGRRERSAASAVFLENVLDDLFAPLVLEIDVDVGRLLALLRDETLEQEIAFLRVYRGDAEAVAHARVGRRTATLAENRRFLLAGPGDDLLDGEEKMLVFELGDQRKLFLDLLSNFGRNAVRPAARGADIRELAQIANRRHAFGHELMR